MPSLRVYLNKDKNSKGLSNVRLQLSDKGKRVTFSTNIFIQEKQWDEKKRMVRGHPFALELNNDLREWQREIEGLIHKHRYDFDLNRAKDKVEEIIRPEPKEEIGQGFFDYLDRFIKDTSKRQPRTVQKYKTLKMILKEWGRELYFDDMDKSTGEEFAAFLSNQKGHLNNTSEKYISCLRTFLTWVEEQGVRVNPAFRKYRGKKHDVEPNYLTEEELLHLYGMNLTGTLEKVRDVFCFACWTGLRYSDVAALEKANIKNDAVNIRMQKTSDLVTIPLNQYSRAILQKWNYRLPVMSNVKTNLYLKELCKEAGFTSPEKVVQFKGTKRIETVHEKWEIMTFHDARRTFIILLLIKGVPLRVIMDMTGHKEVKTLMKYVRIADSVTRDAMKRVWG